MRFTREILIYTVAAFTVLLLPGSAAAQQNVPPQVQQVAVDVESTARRFGFGIQGGVAFDPELIDFGAHATFGPIFRPSIQFRPGIEFGLGEVTTFLGINLDVLYTFPSDTSGWRPNVGGGPNFGYSHQGFESDEDEEGNRFDFSDSDGIAGFNFIAGARSPNGLFIEIKASAYGISNVRLLAGFNF
jgi:hypothetical protein